MDLGKGNTKSIQRDHLLGCEDVNFKKMTLKPKSTLYLCAVKQGLLSEDFYIDKNGLMVFTEAYHLKRGHCCGCACKHCPYAHENVPENKRKMYGRRA